ncbi:MAG: WecB/TagA/CpsF family glycosyltransferase [Candidatus Moranbacteria bacterium]|nr:WecB/TagA/CpsF family glycosyltransferase [Candidatus Moranbacteria bacterium]
MRSEFERTNIIGVRVDNLSKVEVNNWIKNTLDDSPEHKFVTTINPEIALKAHRDKKYQEVLNSADLNLCDGFGIKFISRFKGGKISARYTGVDLVEYVLKLAKEKNFSVLVVVSRKSLSAPQEIERGIAERLNFKAQAKYWDNEDFFQSEEAKKAEIVFVNFGAPHQENFIFENRRKFPKAKILAGVGGTFDFLAGKMKRAPRWTRNAGLEWFWRMLQEPKRMRRIANAVVIFPWVALINRKNK